MIVSSIAPSLTAPLRIHSADEVKSILSEIQVPVVKPDQKEAIRIKQDYKLKLNQAYTLLSANIKKAQLPEEKKELYLLLGDLMTKFGRLRYEENYPSCMVFMRASLNAQLVAIGVFDISCFDVEKSDNLEQLEKALFYHEAFQALDQLIITSNPDALAQAIQSKGMSPDQLARLGFTLSWMANSLHHTQGFKGSEDDKALVAQNNRRFDQIYSLCEKILVASNTNEAKLELAEMYYNGLTGVALRDPTNIKGAHKWFDEAIKLNPSYEMVARVANRKACDWAGVGNFEEAKRCLDEAFTTRGFYSKEFQDPFLIANMYNGRAKLLLLEKKLDEADADIDCALAHSASCRGARNPDTDRLLDTTHDHQYFGTYDIRKAQIKIAKGELTEAIKYINRALETFEHHRQDSAKLIEVAEKMKAEIQSLLTRP